jgi:NodT family efflux transporter outer membrane factor (OMF) lipoprotein
LGPDFKRPQTPQTDRYLPQKPALTEQSLHAGKDIPSDWWRLFRSAKLRALIERALANSPDLAAAKATLRQTRELMIAQESSLLPALDAAGSVKRQKVSGALFGNPGGGGSLFTVYNGSLNLSYTIDVFGGIRRQLESKTAEVEYQRFELEAARLTLVANLVTAAVQEASLRAQIQATETLIADQRQQLDILRQQLELGGIAQPALLAQESLLAQTQATLPPLQRQLEQTRNQLSVLSGQPPGSGLKEEFRLDELDLPRNLPLSLPSKLVEQRPDVRAQEALAHSASAQIGVATTKMFPDFTLTASVGTVATKAGELFMPGSGIWNTGLNLLQPVFHGGQGIHGRRAAIAAFDAAAAQYKSTVLKAFQNVADVLRALEADEAALKAQEAAERTAEASLNIARATHQNGAISYLALLDSERAYQQSRLGLVQAQASRYADTAALFHALGGGWWNRPPEPEKADTVDRSPFSVKRLID